MVVVRRGDDQVGARHLVVLIDAVVVDERAARRLDHAHAARLARAARHEVGAEQVVVVQQVLDGLGGVQHLDHARPVEAERRLRRTPVVERHELPALAVGERRRDEIAAGDPRERPHAIPAVLVAERAQVRELHVRPRLHFLGDLLPVVAVVHVVEDLVPIRLCRTQSAVVEVHRAVRAHEAQRARLERAERAVGLEVFLEQPLHDVHRVAAPRDHLVDVFLQFAALVGGQRLVHAARDRARAVDALAGGVADHFLAVLAQQHSLLGDVRVSGGHAHDVAACHVGIEAEQQVGRAQVEEVQRMRLQDLAVVHQAADLLRRGRELRGAHHLVERLAGREVVAHRADAAQALHHHRHFPVRPALDELLERAELDDVEPRLLDVAVLVHQQRDLAVPLDARQRFDHDAAQLFGVDGGFEGQRAHGCVRFLLNRSGSGRGPTWACGPRSGR